MKNGRLVMTIIILVIAMAWAVSAAEDSFGVITKASKAADAVQGEVIRLWLVDQACDNAWASDPEWQRTMRCPGGDKATLMEE